MHAVTGNVVKFIIYNNLYAFIGQQETSGEITQVYARCFNRDALYLREGTCAQGMLDLPVISYIPSSFYFSVHGYKVIMV